MASATVQLNTRIPAELKRGGDAVFARFGLNPSEVVRCVWQYATRHQDIPAFMKEKETAESAEIDLSPGLAVRLAERDCGYVRKAVSASLAWQEERDGLYDDLLDQMEERCR